MTMNDFIDSLNKKRSEYDFLIEEDCDLWSLMNGFLFYRNEDSKKPFAHITGVRHKKDGTGLEGDFEGFLNLLNGALIKEYETINSQHAI